MGLKKKDIAAAWGTSPQYVSKFSGKCARSGSPMPEFRTPAEAKAWYASRRQRGADRSGQVDGTCDSSADYAPLEEEKARRAGRDFDELMLEDAEEVVLLAKRRYRMAVDGGSDAQAAVWLKHWNEASKNAASQRERWLQVQEKSGRLIQLDIAMDITVATLRDVRSALDNAGERCATRANPERPELAKMVFDEEMDRIVVRISEGTDKLQADFLGRQKVVDRKSQDLGMEEQGDAE